MYSSATEISGQSIQNKLFQVSGIQHYLALDELDDGEPDFPSGNGGDIHIHPVPKRDLNLKILTCSQGNIYSDTHYFKIGESLKAIEF